MPDIRAELPTATRQRRSLFCDEYFYSSKGQVLNTFLLKNHSRAADDVARGVRFDIYRGRVDALLDALLDVRSAASTISPRSTVRTFVLSFLAAATTASHRASRAFPAAARSSRARDDAGDAATSAR